MYGNILILWKQWAGKHRSQLASRALCILLSKFGDPVLNPLNLAGVLCSGISTSVLAPVRLRMLAKL